MADPTNSDVIASSPRPTVADQSVAERFRLASDRRPCPFAGVAYSKVPGYVSGYGCPVCKGIGPAHRDIADPLDFDDVAGAIRKAAAPPTLPADLRGLLDALVAAQDARLEAATPGNQAEWSRRSEAFARAAHAVAEWHRGAGGGR